MLFLEKLNILSVILSLQKDFIERGPVLLKGGKDIVPNVIKAVEVARERGILIVWVITLYSLSESV